MESRIRYARTTDGVDIAYVSVGTGPTLLVLRPLLSPALDAEILGRAPFLELAANRRVVFWDYRGTGYSGAAINQTIETGLLDMQAVIAEIGVTGFDVLGMMAGAHPAIAFAATHPEQVKHLVLWNAARPGNSMRRVWRDMGVPDIADTHFREYLDLAALRIWGWDAADQARRMADRIAERYTSESWALLNESIEEIDAMPLASSVAVPTLVVINRAVPNQALLSAEGQQFMRRLAAVIPAAQLSIVTEPDTRAFIPVVEAFLGAGETGAIESELPHGTAIILFTDIADSTSLTERMGDAAFRAAASALDDRMRPAIREAGGTPVEGKVLGDGVMAVFTSAAQAIDAARRCAALSAESELQLHVGLHAGDVIRERDNVYGGAVNIASRICGLSAPGEILVSATIRDLARTSANVTFEDRGDHAVKGIDDPVRIYAVAATAR